MLKIAYNFFLRRLESSSNCNRYLSLSLGVCVFLPSVEIFWLTFKNWDCFERQTFSHSKFVFVSLRHLFDLYHELHAIPPAGILRVSQSFKFQIFIFLFVSFSHFFLLLATNSILLYTSFMSISFYSLLPEIHFFLFVRLLLLFECVLFRVSLKVSVCLRWENGISLSLSLSYWMCGGRMHRQWMSWVRAK